MEICFFPVPNIDEVQFGTALNKAFGTEVANDLGMGEYKPGSTIRTYLVQYSNAYWAKKVRARETYFDRVHRTRAILVPWETLGYLLSLVDLFVLRYHLIFREENDTALDIHTRKRSPEWTVNMPVRTLNDSLVSFSYSYHYTFRRIPGNCRARFSPLRIKRTYLVP